MKKKLIFIILFALLFSSISYSEIEPVRIAIIDTGISEAVIDNTNIIEGYNYMEETSITEDIIGHGTAISGIIVGAKLVNIDGVAPKAKLIPLVICTETTDDKIIMGDSDILAQAIYDAIDIYGCKIINISSGTLSSSESLQKAVEYAEINGVVLISSVGNDNESCPENVYYPAIYDTVLGVSALRKNGEVASYSQRNQSVSICAPGDRLRVASTSKGKISFGFGTSYATAYVSGAVALIVEKYPNLTPKEIREIICQSADDLDEVGYDTTSGWGALNLEDILN